MHSTIRFIVAIAMVGVTAYCGRFTDQESVIVLSTGMGLLLFGSLTFYLHKRSVDEGESDDTPPHPFASLVSGCVRGLGWLCFLVLVFGVARFATAYRLPWEGPHGRKEPATIVSGVGGRESYVTLKAEQISYDHHKSINFIDVLVPSPEDRANKLATCPLDAFTVTIGNVPQKLASVVRVPYEKPSVFEVVRDVSNSILVVNPFAAIEVETTGHIFDGLHTDKSRDSFIRIVDFAGTAKEVLPWTGSRETTGPLSLANLGRAAEISAVSNTLAQAIEDLGRRSEESRAVIMISDFANNAPKNVTDYYGLLALATKHRVALNFIGLPTKDFVASSAPRLQQLAEKTGGVYIDGSTPNLGDEISEMLEKSKVSVPAYRLSFAGEKPLDPKSLTVTVSMPAPAIPSQVNREPFFEARKF